MRFVRATHRAGVDELLEAVLMAIRTHTDQSDGAHGKGSI